MPACRQATYDEVMQRLLTLTASHLHHFLACEHRAALDLALPRPTGDSAVFERGREHEAAYLDGLKRQGFRVVELATTWSSPAEVQQATFDAMRQGPDFIYQASFWEGPWRGTVDFLKRVEQPSVLGGWRYEPLDTKLARGPKPEFAIQLCFYADLLGRLQGVAPERFHVGLGSGQTLSYRVEEFAAYYRRLRDRFAGWVDDGPPATRPVPVASCGTCPWSARCEAEWRAQDHLSLVANIRGEQIQRLEEAGIATVAALAVADRPRSLSPATFKTLQEQARLQRHHQDTGEHRYALLAHEPGRGLAVLPELSPGDVFFDMEGYPHVEGGLEYLFGAVYAGGFEAFWAHSRQAERRAFEGFIDFVTAKRAEHPGMHVYHYAPYEDTALKRLAGRHGTREAEVDTLLREGVLVDLYRVVRQGLRVSQPSYSIKQLETFYMGARAAEVKTGGDSITAYERWIATGDEQVLREIRDYNEEDCVSTRLLRDWLLERRAELEGQLGSALPWPEPSEEQPSEQAQVVQEAVEALKARLTADLPETELTPDEHARQLLADLLEYHRREEKPLWWSFFHRCGLTPQEMVEDGEGVGQLELTGEPRLEKKSLVYRFAYPAQKHKLRAGSKVHDPATGKSAGEVVAIEDEWLELKRGPTLSQLPLPEAVFPHERFAPTEQKAALVRLATSVAATGIAGRGPYQALRDLLCGALPRIDGWAPGASLQPEVLDVRTAQALACGLQDSVLMLQGPPGAGKTYTGARVIVALLAQGKRVGVGAVSHKAIHNLLAEVEQAAVEAGLRFRGLKKCSADAAESRFDSPHGLIESADKADFTDPAVQLVAGTAFFFPRAELAETLDVLILDEAGQVSLADALAMGMSARGLILLGDPQQLPQVTQGQHPRGSGRSVLEHLLAGADTVPPERGLFLDVTWRMHPAVTAFVSGLSYEGRLRSAPGCEGQAIDHATFGPAGLRYLPVPHRGNTQLSREEGAAVVDTVHQLIGSRFTAKSGQAKLIEPADILVVAPYNMQVELLAGLVPEGVRVGTVDKFQGQEAPVVIFSMATSSGDDLPRNLEFLFNRNRLNVAISRAKCLAVLVASPALLDVRCGTLEQVALVNGLCRLVELARPNEGTASVWLR